MSCSSLHVMFASLLFSPEYESLERAPKVIFVSHTTVFSIYIWLLLGDFFTVWDKFSICSLCWPEIVNLSQLQYLAWKDF